MKITKANREKAEAVIKYHRSICRCDNAHGVCQAFIDCIAQALQDRQDRDSEIAKEFTNSKGTTWIACQEVAEAIQKDGDLE